MDGRLAGLALGKLSVACTGARVACGPWADTLTRTGTHRPRRGSAGAQAAAHRDANSFTMWMSLRDVLTGRPDLL